MAALLKLKCNGEVHRIVLPEAELTYEQIQKVVRSVHPEGAVTLKYFDDERDLCTLCSSTFPDFLSFAEVQNGRTILRLELFVTQPTSAPCSAECSGEGMKDYSQHTSPLEVMMNTFLNMSKAWTPGGEHGGGRHKKRELKFLFMQLHKNGALTAKSAAALAVSSLPHVLAFVAHCPEKIDWKAKQNLPGLRLVVEDLRSLVANTEGLQHCEDKITDFLLHESSSASEALLTLLTALDTLTFESQITFFESFYMSQEALLKEKLAKVDEHHPWIPTIPMLHEGITCDGCGVCPVKGLRFKCQQCPDYDLCGDCYAQKGSIHGDGNSAHQFERISLFPCMPWMAKMACKGFKGMGKGKDKGKGKCAGKGKGKGKCGFGNVDSSDTTKEPRACPGCNFAVTWHPTHCCEACRCHGNGKHGSRCERKPTSVGAVAEQNAEPAKEGTVHQKTFDLSFPVVVEDGRRLTIEWNKSDNLQQVAENFAHQHGIPADELPTILAFVEHAAVSQPEAEPEDLAVEQKEKLDHAQKFLEEMGLGLNQEMLAELLKSHDGSVQKVLEALLAEK